LSRSLGKYLKKVTTVEKIATAKNSEKGLKDQGKKSCKKTQKKIVRGYPSG